MICFYHSLTDTWSRTLLLRVILVVNLQVLKAITLHTSYSHIMQSIFIRPYKYLINNKLTNFNPDQVIIIFISLYQFHCSLKNTGRISNVNA